MSKRNQNFDFIRVIAVFAVVWLHVSNDVVIRDPDVSSVTWWIGNIAEAFSRWCVPLFVMVSGALLLSTSENLAPIDFYIKRTSRLFPSIAFWTLIYIVFREYTEPTFSLIVAAKSIVSGIPYYHLWYLYMVVGLSLATPFLRQLVSGIHPDSLRLLIMGSFTIAAIESALGGTGFTSLGVTFLPRFLPFVGYFLAGYYLFNFPIELRSRWLVSIIFFCGFFIAIGTGVLLLVLGPISYKFLEIMYSFLNPIVVIMSLCIFLLFTKRSISLGPLQRIAPITLGVYVIHPLWMWFFAKFGVTGFLVHPLIGIPTTTILVFALSAVSVALLANIPALRRTVC